MESQLVLTCRHCGHKMKIPGSSMGARRKCVKCGKMLEVSSANTRPLGSLRNRGVLRVSEERTRIGELMVEADLITHSQLAEALDLQKRQGGKLAEVLMSLGHLKRQDFISFLARQPGVATIDLLNYSVSSELVSYVPREFAARHEVFPIDRLGNHLTLGMACPLDKTTIQEIEKITGLRVNAVLCPPADIRAAIRKYYPLTDEEGYYHPDFQATPASGPRAARMAEREDGLAEYESDTGAGDRRLARVAQVIRRLDSLPALPRTVEKVREAMSNVKVSVDDVASIIANDPPIAAKVLSVANSAAYGFKHRVETLELAVSLMGLREAYSIVLSVAVFNLLDRGPTFDYKAFWEESMYCAAASKVIGDACGAEPHSGFFAAGLLHDIGRVALHEAAPDAYREVGAGLTGTALVDAEELCVGLSHPEAGYVLAEHWNLPRDILEAIRYHHAPDRAEEHRDTVAIVGLASRLACKAPTELEATSDLIQQFGDLLKLLGVNESTAVRIFDSIKEMERPRFQ